MIKKWMGIFKSKNNTIITIATIILVFASLLISVFANMPENYPEINVTVVVSTENGESIDNAKIESSKEFSVTDNSGKAVISLNSPDVLKIMKDGYITEILPVGYESNGKQIEVVLLSNKNRVVLNFGGDVMFGRRYEELYKSGMTTTDVVKNIARIFSDGDYQSVNFESVIGDFSESDALKGKKYLLQSLVESINALKELNVNMVCLANNHTRDWGNEGVTNTIKHLDGAGISHVGAGTYDDSNKPNIMTKNDIRIGTLAYTSVTGSVINDSLPDNSAIMPGNVAEDDKWLWDKKKWSWSSQNWSLPEGEYRPGEIWKRYTEIKKELSDYEIAQIESSLEAEFPGIQFLTVQNGRLGSAQFRINDSTRQIEELRKNSDIVIVQLHSGYQYSSAPSKLVIDSARACIDAGADIVIAHHPHVLQGMEWYKGKLIAFSLGNLVFDQNFFSTYSTGILRTTWEGNKMIQAKMVPVEIVNYVPGAVTDVSARNISRKIWDMSQRSAVAEKVNNTIEVRHIERSEGSKPAHIKIENGLAYIEKQTPETKKNIFVKKNQIIQLDNNCLWPGNMNVRDGFKNNSLFIGRDLFGWGHFEDTLADDKNSGNIHMDILEDDKDKLWLCEKNGNAFMRLRRSYTNMQDVLLRPISRIPITNYYSDDKKSVQSSVNRSYSMLASVRGKNDPQLYFRVDLYVDMIGEATSAILQSREYPVKVEVNEWNDVEIVVDIPDTINGMKVNATMIYMGLKPSYTNVNVDIDNFRFVEWNDVADMKPIYSDYSCLKNADEDIELNVTVLGN